MDFDSATYLRIDDDGNVYCIVDEKNIRLQGVEAKVVGKRIDAHHERLIMAVAIKSPEWK